MRRRGGLNKVTSGTRDSGTFLKQCIIRKQIDRRYQQNKKYKITQETSVPKAAKLLESSKGKGPANPHRSGRKRGTTQNEKTQLVGEVIGP